MKKLIGAVLTSVVLLLACKSEKTNTLNADGTKVNADTSFANEKDLTYKKAENYFISNTVKEMIPSKITSQAEFDKYFGKASKMGDNGLPTPIDFSKEYVVVVDHENTTKDTEIKPSSLIKKGNYIILNYMVTEGNEVGFEMRSFLMLIVSKAHEGNIILQLETPATERNNWIIGR